MTKEDNCKALEYYHQAIELDPEYSRAYASIGWAYALSYGEYWADDPQEALDKALEYARKSVEIDRSSHSNHIALGQVYYFRKSLRRAIEAFEQAISLNPNDPDGYVFLSSALSLNGQADKALELLEHAFELNSDLPQWHRGIYVIAYFNLRRYDEAIAAIEKLNNPYISYYRWMAATFAHGGRLDWAKAKAKTYLEAYPDFDLEDHLQRMPFSHEEDREHYAEGLRKAGLVGRN